MSESLNLVDGEQATDGSGFLRPASDVVARRLGDSVVLVRLTTNRIYELNATGARLWDFLLDGLSRETMVQQVVQEFDVSVEMAAADVDALLGLLRAEGLAVQG